VPYCLSVPKRASHFCISKHVICSTFKIFLGSAFGVTNGLESPHQKQLKVQLQWYKTELSACSMG
jgi:hypothetical protein